MNEIKVQSSQLMTPNLTYNSVLLDSDPRYVSEVLVRVLDEVICSTNKAKVMKKWERCSVRRRTNGVHGKRSLFICVEILKTYFLLLGSFLSRFVASG